MAGRFGRALAEAGLTVVSGGARGIDTCAHEGALLAGGRTVVVQGCGLLHNYPKENSRLYERIVAEGAGAVLSDFPLDMPPLKENFPPRNRIIAGLSLGILVIEANLRSGSLITARLAAADYGREVFALPGRADSPASAGTHHLIKTMVAHLVENVGDILENLGEVGAALKGTEEAAAPEAAPADAMAEIAAASPAAATAAATVSLTADQQRILTAMGSEPTAIDEIIEETGLSVAVVMAQLTLLQIGGVIGRAPRNRFVKGRGAG